jgi:urea carboxylase-associated protein 1
MPEDHDARARAPALFTPTEATMTVTREIGEVSDVDGEILEDITVPAGQPWGRKLEAGQRLRIIDLEGKQAVDFLCYDAAAPRDRYNAANTMKMGANIFLREGSVLWSDRGNRLMTVVVDTCGYHDTIGGCCSEEMNRIRYNEAGPGNCRDTFELALKPFGLTRDDIATNVNWFMYVPVEKDGTMAIVDGISKPGDYVDLRAERDVICVASNCTQIFNPANGFKPTPVRIITYAPRL